MMKNFVQLFLNPFRVSGYPIRMIRQKSTRPKSQMLLAAAVFQAHKIFCVKEDVLSWKLKSAVILGGITLIKVHKYHHSLKSEKSAI